MHGQQNIYIKKKEYVIIIASSLLQWLHEHSSILHITHIACRVKFYTKK